MSIDIHAHVFPDDVTKRASGYIGSFYQTTTEEDGSVAALLASAKKAGITKAVIHSAAIRPDRVENIQQFIYEACQMYPDRLLGFGTSHPLCMTMEKEMDWAVEHGFKGLKLHPDQQRFLLDDPICYPMYRAAEERKLILLIHTGDDRYPYSHPSRMARVLDKFPQLTCICAHFGHWGTWLDGDQYFAGRPNVYTDCSSAIPKEESLRIIHACGADHVLFGTDFPMWDPEEEVARVQALGLPKEEEDMIFYKNSTNLLRL